jgi:FtsP/CotA-like multicopper oxidase with cupredoxin domain
MKQNSVSRREFLKAGLGLVGLGAAGQLAAAFRPANRHGNAVAAAGDALLAPGGHSAHSSLLMPGVVGQVNHQANGFHPSELLTDFDGGRVSVLPSGQTLREYDFIAGAKTIEIMPGLRYDAWTYNGRVPGPTIRVNQGDRVRVNLLNATGHQHTIHFHGIHPAGMDGVFEPVPPGATFTYEFDAEPFGLHLYHCHVAPLASHISRGLYGAFIIDPPGGRPPAGREFIMVMAGFDPDFDGANNIYTVNTIPFHYDHEPIRVKVGELVRLYVVNILEYDQTNSFHLHGNLFQYYPTGTSLAPSEYTDIVSFVQGQRGIMEFRYRYPGRYMFHAHKTEFAELGWTGTFLVEE